MATTKTATTTKPVKTRKPKEELDDTFGFIEGTHEHLDQWLTREMMEQAKTFNRMSALSMVNHYYAIQNLRKAANNKKTAVELKRATEHSPAILEGIIKGHEFFEKRIALALAAYAQCQPLGQWCMTIPGIQSIFASALCAHVDFHRCCCKQFAELQKAGEELPAHECPGLANAGHLIYFAGQCDPEIYKDRWKKGSKRPFNMRLKTICWNIGRSFMMLAPKRRHEGCETLEDIAHADADYAERKGVKLSYAQALKDANEEAEKGRDPRIKFAEKYQKMINDPARVYVKMYYDHRQLQEERNEKGENMGAAFAKLEAADHNKWAISPAQRKTWASGKIQDEGLNLRATRYATRLFLNHFFEVGTWLHHKRKSVPYVIAHKGHSHYIAPPNFKFV
jgi:hypothetical protein